MGLVPKTHKMNALEKKAFTEAVGLVEKAMGEINRVQYRSRKLDEAVGSVRAKLSAAASGDLADDLLAIHHESGKVFDHSEHPAGTLTSALGWLNALRDSSNA